VRYGSVVRVAFLLLVVACSVERGGLASEAYLDGGRDAACVTRVESCNGLDDDCNGVVDDVADEACGTTNEDGVCTPGVFRCAEGRRVCEGAVLPASEACETGLDEDCDGEIDEDCGCTPGEVGACGLSEEGECRLGERTCVEGGTFGECLGAAEPSAESCNGLDDDCDGETDEGLRQPFYGDTDGDGFGLATMVLAACSPPEGYVADDRDCDDTCRECYPLRDEICDERDNDCDGEVDEGLLRTVYRDVDADRFGNPEESMEVCGDVPPGWVAAAGDCNDLNAAIQPLAIELCNMIDENCDGVADEGCGAECNRVELPSGRYHFCRSGRSWTDARDFCGTLDATLVTIDSTEENELLRAASQIVRGGEWWLGLNDRETEDTFRWVGRDSAFRNWGSGEPNDVGNEDCAELRSDGRWNDERCSDANPFVCEGR
jgi:hypothetical protein